MMGLGLSLGLSRHSGGSAPFTDPLSDSGTFGWWSTQEGVTDDTGEVTQVDDQSGSGNHLVPISGVARPETGTRTINGLNVLDFDGGDVLRNASITFPESGNFAFHFVTQIDAIVSTAQSLIGILDPDNSDGFQDFAFIANNASEFHGRLTGRSALSANVDLSAVDRSALAVWSIVYDFGAGTASVWHQGEIIASGSYVNKISGARSVHIFSAENTTPASRPDGAWGGASLTETVTASSGANHRAFWANKYNVELANQGSLGFDGETLSATAGATFPIVNSYTTAAGTRGVLINTATTGAEVPTVTVDGSAAELIATAGTEQSDRKTVTTAIYYYETTASSVSISVDRTQDSNLGCIVAATSITGGAIQSWRAYAVAPPLGTPPLTITVPGVDWGQTDFTYGVLVGEDDPTASAFAEVDDGNAQSGTVQMSFGAKVQGFSGSQQSLTWTTSGIADACIGLVVVGSPAVRDTLRIDALPFKMVYSKTGASASVPVSGAYDGTAPTGVEVRVLNYDNDAEVVTWTEVDSSPSGGAWSGSITVPESTSAYKVQARRTGTTDVVESPNRFGVGVWVVDYGQSNSRRHETTSPASDAVGTGSTSTGRRTDGAREGIELVPVGDFGGIAGLISEIESLMGCAVGYVNGAVAANPLSNLKKGTSNYSDLLADLQAIGQDFNVLLWAQGENEGNGVPPAGHKADVIQLHSDLAADLGTTTAAMPMILGPLGPTTIGADDDNWSEISGALIDAADETTDIHLLGGIADTVLVDGVHYTAESYRQIGKRRAYEIARLNGDVTGSAVFRIVGITKVSTTIIDVNLTHGIGTDFTPATGITGLVVSANSDMSSPITPASVVRQDANTIRITLNGGDAIAGAVYVTHLYGANPTVTGLVVDNSTYTMPLLNQFTPLSAS